MLTVYYYFDGLRATSLIVVAPQARAGRIAELKSWNGFVAVDTSK